MEHEFEAANRGTTADSVVASWIDIIDVFKGQVDDVVALC